MDILCVGQIAADVLVQPVDRLDFSVDTTRIEGVTLSCGGDCLNTSMALKKLGVDLELVSIVGNDIFGRFLVDSIAELGIPTGSIRRHPTESTTVAVVMINSHSERVFYYLPGACDQFSFADVPKEKVRESRIVHVGGFYQLRRFGGEEVAKLMKLAKAENKVTSMDVTWDTSGGWQSIAPVLPYLDYFFPSYGEAKEITGETEPAAIAAKLREMGAKNVVLKMGAQGGYADTGEGRFAFPAFDVPVRDTTGAGDCFAAGLLTGLSRGWDIRRGIRFASAVSAFGIQEVGATTGVPDYDTVMRFLSEREDG